MKTLSILFGGEEHPIRLVNGTAGRVFVRALPQQHLGHVLAWAEHKHRIIELTAYFRAAPKKRSPDHPLDAAVRVSGTPAFPDVEAPDGYMPVPMGWTANLDDKSFDQLFELAKALNFSRAADWGKGQIAAKKFVAPIHAMAVEQVMPLMERVIEPLMTRLERLFASMRNSPSSASAESSSSGKTSSGSRS